MLSWSPSSVDEFFASFAYKKKEEGGLRWPSRIPPKPNSSRSSSKVTDDDPVPIPSTTTIGGGQTKTKVVSEAARACKRPTYQQSADPNSRRRVSSSNPPSSWTRVTLGDKTKVVSNYFPLPTGASNPVVLSRKEVDKAGRTRIKRVLEDGEPKRSRRPRQKKTPPRQLSAAEKKSDAYKRVDRDKWIKPPISPYNLLQERHSFDPWRVLIICMLLNVTTGKQVSRVLPGLFRLCPNAEAATKVPEEEIKKEIQSLGIHTKRAKMIKQFSGEYLGTAWTHVTQLYGVGKYAADAYAILVAGKAKAVIPVDRMLVKYWKFVCGKDDGDNSVVPQN